MDKPEVGRDRHAQVRRLTGEMESVRIIAEGQFSALGMFVTDASLAADRPALEAAQDGLQWIYSRQEALTDPDADQIEQRGRLLGLIDVTHWALRRLPSHARPQHPQFPHRLTPAFRASALCPLRRPHVPSSRSRAPIVSRPAW